MGKLYEVANLLEQVQQNSVVPNRIYPEPVRFDIVPIVGGGPPRSYYRKIADLDKKLIRRQRREWTYENISGNIYPFQVQTIKAQHFNNYMRK